MSYLGNPSQDIGWKRRFLDRALRKAVNICVKEQPGDINKPGVRLIPKLVKAIKVLADGGSFAAARKKVARACYNEKRVLWMDKRLARAHEAHARGHKNAYNDAYLRTSSRTSYKRTRVQEI